MVEPHVQGFPQAGKGIAGPGSGDKLAGVQEVLVILPGQDIQHGIGAGDEVQLGFSGPKYS
jgi:hypothetical protein